MNDQTISELLILGLTAFSCARIFFTQHVKSDSASVVPLIALILSVLSFFAWGISYGGIVIFILCIFNFIWNLSALFRLNSRLVIDSYSFLFVVISIFNLLLSLVLGAFLFITRPVRLNEKKFTVTETKQLYTGSLSDGYSVSQKKFEKNYSVFYKFTNSSEEFDHSKNDRIILFVPEKCASVETYRPYLYLLAQKGFTVYAAEFYDSSVTYFGPVADSVFLRKFIFYHLKLFMPQKYNELAEASQNVFLSEYYRLFTIVQNDSDYSSGKQIILVNDNPDFNTAQNAAKLISADCKFLNLSDVSEYSTKGWGPVEQTDGILSLILGKKRDSSLYMSAHLAKITEEIK